MQKIQKHIIAYWIKKSHILSTVFWKIIYIYRCIAPKKTGLRTYITEKTATRIWFFQNASKKNKKHTQCRKTISWYYFFWTFLPFIYIFVIFTYRHTSFTFKRSNFTMLTPFQVSYHDQPSGSDLQRNMLLDSALTRASQGTPRAWRDQQSVYLHTAILETPRTPQSGNCFREHHSCKRLHMETLPCT